MAWKAFSAFAGFSVWWAIGMGVTNALTAKSNPIGAIVGLFGALIAGVAVGSYINDLPRSRRRISEAASAPAAPRSDSHPAARF